MKFFENWLQHVRVRNKLLMGFGAILVLIMTMSVVSYVSVSSLLAQFRTANSVSNISEHIGNARYNEKKYLLRSQPEFIEQARAEVELALSLSGSAANEMSNRISAAQIDKLTSNAVQYQAQLREFVKINEQSEAAQLEMEVSASEAVKALKQLSGELEAEAINNIASAGNGQSREALATVRLINEAVQLLLEARKAERDYVYRRSDTALQKMQRSMGALKQDLTALERLRTNTAYAQMIDDVQAQVIRYEQQFREFQNLSAASERAQTVLTTEAREAVSNATSTVQLQLEQLNGEADTLQAIIIGSAAGAIILALIVAFVITRQITLPVNEVLVATSRLADGDLTQSLASDRKDEMGDLIRATQDMNERLKDLIWNTISGVTQLASSSEQLAAVTEQNKAGVESQREDTEQVATAIEEMTSTAQEIARSAEDTSAATNESSEQAKQSDTVVEQTVQQINRLTSEIGESSNVITQLKNESKNVDNILDVIRDIAERTNLLALNAAIEAARAGEAGRGFAVVAQEVRDLAQRTQDSTNQIEGIIDSLQVKAEQAVQKMDKSKGLADKTIEMANNAKQAIAKITAAIVDIQERNYQVATAATQQSAVATDINEKVVSIRDVADETATATNQIAASTLDLSRLSAELQAQTKQFRMDSQDVRKAQQEGMEALDAGNTLSPSQTDSKTAMSEVMAAQPVMA